MANQLSLIPVSPREFQEAAYQLAQLLQQKDDEKESFKETTQAHKEMMTVLDRGITEKRQIIRRAQLEREEGITAAQVDALLDSTREQHEEVTDAEEIP